MADKQTSGCSGHFFVLAASFVIVVAGMKAASGIIIPFLLATFIAVICSAPLAWLKRHKVPTPLAIIAVLLIVAVAGTLVVMIIGGSISSFSTKLPQYQALFTTKTNALVAWLNSHGLHVSNKAVTEHLDPSAIMKMVAQLMMGLSSVLTNAVMIMLTVLIILLEATVLPRKIELAADKPQRVAKQTNDIIAGINNYLSVKTLFSALTGLSVALFLWIIGVDFALLWGLLAFMLNYIPNIGSFIAAIPAILLALIQLGAGYAIITAAGFAVINFIFGSFFEPRMLGRRLGLSTLVIFISLVFWGWVLGPVGMFLSIPMTMIIKIALEHNEKTRKIAILIGSAP